jgi:hypothetical protein
MTEVVERTEGKYEDLRHLADTYMQCQRLRIANSNRAFASTKGTDETTPEPFVVEVAADFEALEKKIFRQMKRTVKHHPAWEWLDNIKGMGPTLSTQVLGLIADIEKFDTVSKLWSFSGYGLKDGKRQVPIKGQKLSYNRRLKTALYNCGDSFIKSRSPYRDIYDESKAYYRLGKQIAPLRRILGEDRPGEELIVLRETPEGKKEWDKLIKEANKKAGEDQAVWSDGHVDNAARRKMVKLFLSHLWLVWREAEGLEVSDPYVIASPNHPEHSHKIDPWSFSG